MLLLFSFSLALHHCAVPLRRPAVVRPRGLASVVQQREPNALPTDLGPLPPVGDTLQQRTAKSVSVVSLSLDGEPMPVPLVDPRDTFVDLFRACTPYIKMHQGSTMVIHVASEVLDRQELFDPIMEEIAVLALLGVRPVLLVGVKQQIEASLRERGYLEEAGTTRDGVRRTSERAMRVVQEVSGFMRARVEGALARGRSRSGPLGGVGVDVVGGNFFYTAQPVGVRDGIDFGFTGEVRSIDVPKVNQHLKNGEIVLMTALGYSASGTVFNVKTEQIAASAAAALGASKLIFLTPHRLVETVLQSLRLAEAKALMRDYRLIASAGEETDTPTTASNTPTTASNAAKTASDAAKTASDAAPASAPLPSVVTNLADAAAEASMFDLCKHCVRALELGVTRAHLLPPTPGALIQELYTTDGIGTLISRDVYDGIRLAAASDIPNILDLIAPLETAGVLIKRPPEVLARDVHMGYYYVYTRDNTLLACAQLKRYSSTHAELGCLVVAPSYRRQGCGDAMLVFLERTAIAAGIETLFALSTHTMQWFMERGFHECPLDALPERRIAIYDRKRGSKIYSKALKDSRSLDAEELFFRM